MERQIEPVRQRWIYEEYVMGTPTLERRQWEGVDMAVANIFVRLCARSPFMAGAMFMGLLILTSYLTLSIVFGIRLRQVDSGVIGWLLPPPAAVTKSSSKAPVKGH